jgi:hypothetical protein
MERFSQVKKIACGIALACLIPLMGAKQWTLGSRSFYHSSGSTSMTWDAIYLGSN